MKIESVCWFPLSRGLWTQVSLLDAAEASEHIWSASCHKDTTYAKGKKGYLHQLLLRSKGGDHKNRNGLDNRRSNLRVATRSQNNSNRRKWKNTSSQFKGVSLHQKTGLWSVFIKCNEKHKYLGSFNNEVEAARVYDKAALEVFGEFAKPNFPVDCRGVIG